MRQSKSDTFTYQTRVHLQDDHAAILQLYAELMCSLERKLFKDISTGKNSNPLKSSYLTQFGITARQFNGVKVQLEGKIASTKERRKGQIAETKNRIQSLEKNIQKSEKRKESTVVHQKKRRLFRLKSILNTLVSDEESGKVRICFGSKKLFHQQFFLSENGYASLQEWKKKWQQTRNSSFFLLGSKDETGGNQSCTAHVQSDGKLTFRLRLPHVLAEKYGKYLIIPNVHFQYGHDVVLANVEHCEERNRLQKQKNSFYKEYGTALSYRFFRNEKGWTLFVSTSLREPKVVTRKELGVIGVDINADHLALCETDRFGNPIKHKSIPLVSYGKTKHQAKALTAEIAIEVVNWAKENQKPLVVEKLDFQQKKAELREQNRAKKSRMLSSFAYGSIISAIHSRAFRTGVQVESINPAFTSLIGRVKFAKRYGLTIHESAALCIGRRCLGVSERLPRHLEKIPDGRGGHVTFSLPERNREKHVWSSWRQVQRKLSAVLAAHFLAIKRSSCQARPTCCDRKILQGIVGEIPIREPSFSLLD